MMGVLCRLVATLVFAFMLSNLPRMSDSVGLEGFSNPAQVGAAKFRVRLSSFFHWCGLLAAV